MSAHNSAWRGFSFLLIIIMLVNLLAPAVPARGKALDPPAERALTEGDTAQGGEATEAADDSHTPPSLPPPPPARTADGDRLQRSRTAAQIASIEIGPPDTVAGTNVAITMTLRNIGTVALDPGKLVATVALLDGAGSEVATGQGADALAAAPILPGETATVVAGMRLPASLAGHYRYAAALSFQETLLDRVESDGATINVAAAEPGSTTDAPAVPAAPADTHAVDIVFAMDTSGSMSDEFDALCAKIGDVVDALYARGVTVNYQILGIDSERDCTQGTVSGAVPGGLVNHIEDWAPAVHDLASGYSWASGYSRLVIPMSDEGSDNGNPCYDPGADRDAVNVAISAAQNNAVFVSPVLGSWYNSSEAQCITTLAEDLAGATGGHVFYSTDPAADLADGIAAIAEGAAGADPLAEQAPTSLVGLDRAAVWQDADADERFGWAHPAVEAGDAIAFGQAYHDTETNLEQTFDIPITRYYGETDGSGVLTATVTENAIIDTAIVVCAWDIDRLERVYLSVNGHPMNRNLRLDGRNGDSECLRYDIDAEWLRFPDSPGNRSDPAVSASQATSPTSAMNTIDVEYDGEYKSLIYEVELIIEAVRPVVLVPGFSAEASTYPWGEIETQLGDRGVPVEVPCHYVLSIEGAYLLYERIAERMPHDGTVVDIFGFISDRCFEAAKTDSTLVDLSAAISGRGTLDTNSRRLGEAVGEVKTILGVDKVNLVGHSKGGLFSRAYVEEGHYQQDVENLITISSPNQGIWLMDLVVDDDLHLPRFWAALVFCIDGYLCTRSASFVEDAFANSFGRLFNRHDITGYEITMHGVQDRFDSGPTPGVHYTSVAATAGLALSNSGLDLTHANMNGFGTSIIALGLGGYQAAYKINYYLDNVASDYIENTLDKDPDAVRGQSDITMSTAMQRVDLLPGFEDADCIGIRANHDESRKERPAAMAVLQALGLDADESELYSCDEVRTMPQGTAPGAPDDVEATHDTHETAHSVSYSGVITPGEQISVPLSIDGDHLELMGLWRGGSSVDLTLEDAGGTLITPDDDASDNISYTDSWDETAGAGSTTYLITETVKGNWFAHLTVPYTTTDPGATSWDLIAAQQSPLSLTVSTNPTVTTGGDVTIHAQVLSDTTPLLNATVTGEVQSWVGVTQTVTLHDDGAHNDGAAGDGLYGTIVTVSDPAIYDVKLTASGSTPGGLPYELQQGSEIQVNPMSAHFTGSYAGAGVDTDGDGLFDGLAVDVGVGLDQDGQYTLLGQLSTASGVPLGTDAAVVSGTAGTVSTAHLIFPASLFVQNQVDGPVVLTMVRLWDQQAHLPTAQMESVFTSAVSYSHLDFHGGEAQITGFLSDQGVDEDGNGSYDYLLAELPLQVRRPGQYTATARLQAGTESVVAQPVTLTTTTVNESATVSLRFDGASIAIGAASGPYTVTNFILEGPAGVALSEPVLGTTAAYDIADFEADTVAPTSAIDPLPATITDTTSFSVTWSGADPDPATEIAYFEVQFKAGADGTWTDWFTRTVLTGYEFGPFLPVTVTNGTTYYFQVRAVDYAGNSETYPGGNGDAGTTVLGVDLSVEKSGPAVVEAGSYATFDLTYRNHGPMAARDVVLVDTLPPGLTYDSDNSAVPVTRSGNELSWSLGEVPPFANVTFQLTTVVSPSLPNGTELQNALAIATSDAESDYDNNSALTNSLVQFPRDLYVYKDYLNYPGTAGGLMTYWIYFQNMSSGVLTDVVVTDTLPAGTTFESWYGYAYNLDYVDLDAAITPTVTGEQITWPLGRLEAQAYGYLVFTVRLDSDLATGSLLENVAEIGPLAGDVTPGDNVYTRTTAVSDPLHDLYAFKQLSGDAPGPGGRASYRLNVYNRGNSAVSNVEITDTLPSGASLVSWYGYHCGDVCTGFSDDITPDISGRQIVWRFDGLEQYARIYLYPRIEIAEGANVGDPLENVVAVGFDQVDVYPADNVFTHTTTVASPLVNLWPSKSVTGGTLSPGKDVVYTIGLVNGGNTPAHDVVLTDTIPANTTFVSADSPFPYSTEANTIVFDVGTLPNDEWQSVELTVNLDTDTPSGTEITNEAHVTTSDAETDPYDNNASASFEVQPPFAPSGDILLVEDTWSSNGLFTTSYYTSTLNALGEGYDLWRAGARGEVDEETLAAYVDGVVVWSMPYFGFLFNQRQRDALSTYLDSGGKLFISGQDVAYYGRDWPFLSDYLHAQFAQDDPGWRSLQGSDGDIIGDGLSLQISGGDGANNQWFPDEVDPLAPAIPFLTYTATHTAETTATTPAQPDALQAAELSAPLMREERPPLMPAAATDSGTGGLRVDAGTYKVVYLSFGFEAISTHQNRELLLERSLAYLRGLPEPSLVSPTDAGTVTSESVTLSWEPVAGATEYEVQIDTQPDFSSPDLIEVSTAEVSHQETLADGEWYWRVRAWNEDGLRSDFASAWSFHVDSIQQATASFTASPTQGAVPLEVNFTNLSGGDYETCNWSFGDGGTSAQCTGVSHTYTAPGTYTVTLTIDGRGGSDTETRPNYVVVEREKQFLPVVLRP